MIIETANLRIQSHTPAQLLALFKGVEQYEALIGLRAAEGFGDFYSSDNVSPDWVARLREESEPNRWLLGFAIVHRETEFVIGSIGFTGPPDDDGVVEIGYGIVPGYQRRGYATEAARVVVEFAFGHDIVRRVRAHTMPEPNASTTVLTRCGFEFLGGVVVPEDGPVWRWEKARPVP